MCFDFKKKEQWVKLCEYYRFTLCSLKVWPRISAHIFWLFHPLCSWSWQNTSLDYLDLPIKNDTVLLLPSVNSFSQSDSWTPCSSCKLSSSPSTTFFIFQFTLSSILITIILWLHQNLQLIFFFLLNPIIPQPLPYLA